ncbi:unnamed protein product [Rotaria magnacalcarata]|uniref:Uncharacterized protein n=2 Tax=Rotaria magnacalcarata TaxID=392030 RepID=A0A816SAG1_9BILA|nr:unnamed protein product [Rotaria magnacalcarata]CAF4128459.1 unnamed protein product [Rotaria magnacalcarata]
MDCNSTALISCNPSISTLAQPYARRMGFNAKNKHTIDSVYICQICNLILRDPVQLNCGDRLCKSCVDATEGEKIQCPECGEQSEKKYVLLDRGYKNDMQTLPIECTHCNWRGSLKQYQDHIVQPHLNVTCEYCDKTCDSISNLDVHKVNECTKVTEICSLKNYGCTIPIIKGQKYEHYMTELHQIAINNYICRNVLESRVDQRDRVYGMDTDTPFHTTTSSSDDRNVQLQELSQTTDILAGGVSALNEDCQRLRNESVSIQNALDTLSRDFTALKLSIEEQNKYLDDLKPSSDLLDHQVSMLQQTLEDLRSVSFDGTFLWKITNFSSKMADAQAERQTSIYSPPFYSSPTGYKMRVRLYPNGDGNARRTHVSLFFVLMRGEYDPILKFPFNYKVTFCLYDQTPTQQHIIDSFRPDINSNSFQRPRSEMNIASGIPKFCSLSVIQPQGNCYIRDDTIFIKIMVDFGDTPKAMLPFALSLNPAFSINVQQTLIKQETEKRAQQTSTSSTIGTILPH